MQRKFVTLYHWRYDHNFNYHIRRIQSGNRNHVTMVVELKNSKSHEQLNGNHINIDIYLDLYRVRQSTKSNNIKFEKSKNTYIVKQTTYKRGTLAGTCDLMNGKRNIIKLLDNGLE